MIIKCHSKISGVGVSIPKNSISSIALMEETKCESRLGIPSNWIDENVGIVSRHVSAKSLLPSEFASEAAINALTDSGISVDEIDAIIYCGIMGDYIEPGTAHVIQHQIGAYNAFCRDVSNACHGFCDGLNTADMLINSGLNHVLVVTAELSRVYDHVIPTLQHAKSQKDFMSMVGMLTVGDAAGAMVLSRKDNPETGFHLFNCQSIGQHSKLCYYNILQDGAFSGGMIMDKISGLMIRLNNRLKHHTLKSVGWQTDEIDHLIMHQVGIKPFRRMLEIFQVNPQKAPLSLNTFGNITTATIPLNYAKLSKENKFNAGDRVFISGGGSGVILSHLCLTI